MGKLVEPQTGSLASRPANATPVHLTPRQLDVLALLCDGLPNKLIGRQLNISSSTVKIHVTAILRELNVASRLQAVIAARRLRLIDGEPASGKMAQPERAPELRQPITLRIAWDSISAQWQAAAANEPLTGAAV
jgi:DNA-binding CsgD family transcriptional regulator